MSDIWAPVPFAGGSYADETMPWTRQDTVNYLPTRAERSGARSDMILKQCPGMRIVSNLGNGPIRATYNVEGMLLAVSGDKLFRIGTDYIGYLIGTIPGVGRISVAHNKVANGNQVLFATGSSGYVYSTADNSLAPITDEGYPGAMCVRFIGQYFAQIEPQRRYWFISDLADGFSYNTLDTFEAEAQPDKLYSLEANAGRLFAFGERTIECYDNVVTENAAFQRSGIVIDRGVASGFATCVIDNAVIFLGNDGVVYRMDGYNPVRISHHPLETALAASDLRRAFFTTWEDRGHKVAYLTLQDGNTWGYDVASQEWHRRESYGLNRWRANTLTKWNGQWIAGDYASGKLYALEWDHGYEGYDPLVRERTFAVLHNDFNPVRVNAVRFLVDTGGPESVPQGDPAVPAIGPTITGSAPDGIVGEEYSFTYTTTAGDAAIVKTTIDETALLAGLEWDESTATISGTPTVAGTMTITPHVIDANGLWAELTDTVVVIPAGEIPLEIRYLETTPSDDTDYSAVDFDDSEWPIGEFAFGDGVWGSGDNNPPTYYGFPSNDVNTTITDMTRVWVRSNFTLAGIPESLRVQAFVDNIITLYINGALVGEYADSGVPPDAFYQDIAIDPELLVVGDNHIAAMLDDLGPVGDGNHIYYTLRIVV